MRLLMIEGEGPDGLCWQPIPKGRRDHRLSRPFIPLHQRTAAIYQKSGGGSTFFDGRDRG